MYLQRHQLGLILDELRHSLLKQARVLSVVSSDCHAGFLFYKVSSLQQNPQIAKCS
jgi:hypothetical protein